MTNHATIEAGSTGPQLIANIEAEAALLGAMFASNKIIDGVADIVTHEDFAEGLHAILFAAIVQQASQGKAATIFSVKPMVEADPRWQDVGGVQSYLAKLTGSGIAVAGARDLAEQIRDLSRRRAMIAALQSAIDAAGDMERNLADAVADADSALQGASADNFDGVKQLSAADCVQAVIDDFNKPKARILSGIEPLDGVLGALSPGDLIIKAGLPGMGKSAEALCYAYGAACKGHGGLFISLEMPAKQLGARLVAHHLAGGSPGVPFGAIMADDLCNNQKREVIRALDAIGDLPLYTVVAPALKLGRLSMMIGRWKRRMEARGQKLAVVYVDYLQLLRPDYRMNSEFEAVSEISKSLKGMALQHDVAIVALSQLNRSIHARDDKRPKMSDLRSSGQIEQDADAIMFVHREEYHLSKSEPPPNHPDRLTWEQAIAEVRGQIEFIVVKRRNGVEGVGIGSWNGATQSVA